MKSGILGFSRKEVLWFASILFSSIILMIIATARLINKYSDNSLRNYETIKGLASDITNFQELSVHALNTQRNSLGLLVYTSDTSELKNTKASLLRNRDSLVSRLKIILTKNSIEQPMKDSLRVAAQNYLEKNDTFLQLSAGKKDSAATYNVNVMRPVLRKFNDLARRANAFIVSRIHQASENKLDLLSQYEFWLLIIVILPYVYFLYRFLHLIIRMLFWDTFL